MVLGAVKKGGDAAMGPLIKAMDALKSQVQIAIGFADNAQKASLALGQTYSQTRDSLGSTMQGLRGDLNQKFSAGIAGMEAGLQGNTAGVARLINQQQLTGTAHRATAKAMAELEAGMNLSRQDTNLLSDSLVDTGAEWQISTDKLVGAIDALKSTFPAQKLAGMGANVMEAVTLLQAELGPSLADPLNSVMKTLFDSSQEGLATINKLGLAGVREQLSSDQTTQESLAILKDAVLTGSDTYKRHTFGANKDFRRLGVASENLSRGAINFTTVMDAFGDRVKNEDPFRDFGLTLDNLKREALVPFQEGLSLAHPFLVELADVLSGIANTVGKRFKEFAESLGGESGAAETMKNFKLAILDFAVVALGKLEGAFSFMKIAITKGVPAAMDMLGTAIFHFVKGGGVFDKLKVGLLMVIQGLAQMGDFLKLPGAKEAAEKALMERVILEQRIHFMDNRAKDMADQRRQDAFYRSGKNPLEFMKSYNPSEKSAIAQALEQASTMSFGENAKRSPMYQQLFDMRESIENSENLTRETNDILEDINDKTPDLETKSAYLGDTASMLSENLESILGIGADTTSSEMLEELRVANQQRAAQEASSPLSKTQNNS